MTHAIPVRFDLKGNGFLVAALCINAFGAGMFAPFSILYVHDVASLSLSMIGFVLTSATLLTLAITPLTGSLVDRFGARNLVVLSQMLEAGGVGIPLRQPSLPKSPDPATVNVGMG